MPTTLGLDLGTNSIGWALIETDEEGRPAGLIDLGSRIFLEAVTPDKRVPKNRTRREKRAARRSYARRRMRRDSLVSILRSQGMLPAPGPEFESLFHDIERNPYLLRAKGLDEKLTLHEFGRVLYHLGRRRGFMSNRKAKGIPETDDPEVLAILEAEEQAEVQRAAEREAKARAKAEAAGKTYKPKDEDEGVVLAGIAAIRQKLGQPGARTLGEFLYHEMLKGEPARRRHTDRSMYEEEFEAIWSAQAKHFPELTDALKAQVYQALFWQRPLKVQRFLVGNCPFMTDRKRARRAFPEVQEFRIWQDVNNILLSQPGEREPRRLTQEQRQRLFEMLNDPDGVDKDCKLKWSKIRKALRIDPNDIMNLEEGGKEALIGNKTHISLTRILGTAWTALTQDKQNALITDIISIETKAALLRRLRKHWGFSARQAYDLAVYEPEPGVAGISLQAVRKILPHLRDGKRYDEACSAAGFDHRGKSRRSLDKLTAEEQPDTRNPVVNRCLTEVRRVVNAISARYGVPSAVRIELARDLKLSKKEKVDLEKANKANRRANEEAADAVRLITKSEHPSRDDLIKYRLWKECEGLCPYTGTTISESMLFSSAVDVEHIIPYSVSLDDSFANKTLCMAEENRQTKKKRTPYQAYGSDPAKYAEILRRVDAMKCGRRKKHLFRLTEVDADSFVSRQLNDTRYASVAAKDFIARLGCDVQVTKGEATAVLRHRWGLNSILSDDAEKNRQDHRHHAIDAVVIALTDRSLFKRLSDASAKTGTGPWSRDLEIPEPWAGFRDDIAVRVRAINVSHQVNRKVYGALHEETAYGARPAERRYVYRKSVEDLVAGESETEVGRIRDPGLRTQILDRIAKARNARDSGISKVDAIAAALAEPVVVRSRDGSVAADERGRPRIVRRVRLSARMSWGTLIGVGEDGDVYKHFPKGSNHHVVILEDRTTGERSARVVSMFEAVQRVRANKSPFASDYGPALRPVAHLCKNDTVLLAGEQPGLFRVTQFSDTGGLDIHVCRLHDGVGESKVRLRSPAALKQIECRIILDPLGHVIGQGD